MKPPSIPRRLRGEVMGELRTYRREVDCTWPRRHQGRPRCGNCFACDRATAVEMTAAGARFHQ